MTISTADHTTAAVGPSDSGEGDRARGAVMSLRDPLVRSLEVEWRLLVERTGAQVAGWADRHPGLAGCRHLDDVLVAVRDRGDVALAGLLAEQSSGDDLAGRAVVHTMLPAMIAMARRDHEFGVGDYVAWLWIRVRTYPLERRPHRIAANLKLDTLKWVVGERASELTVDGPGGPLSELVDRQASRDSLDHNADVGRVSATAMIAAARTTGVIDGPTGEVLAAVYAEGLSGREAAQRHGTSVDMVRWRCSRGVRRMAARAAQLADCA